MSKTTVKKPKLKVLYQCLGGTWYAFASVGDEMFMGKVPLLASAEGTETVQKAKAAQGTPRKRSLRKVSEAA